MPAPAWAATLHDYGPLLLAAARAIARDEAEAEDLVQTTFERALRAAPTIRDPAAIRAWLMTVQTREALRVVRRLRRTLRLDVSIHELPSVGPDASESLEVDEALGRLSRPIEPPWSSTTWSDSPCARRPKPWASRRTRRRPGCELGSRDCGSCSMSNVTKGGATAGDEIEKRLVRHFAAELERARRDYPNLGRAGRTGASAASPRRLRLWPWLALPVTAVVIVVAAGLAIAGWASGPLSVKSGPVNPGATGVVMGSDGLPTEIEGQHVYRLDARYDWQKLSGSFLLGAHAVDAPIPCAPPLPSTHPQSLAEADLVPQCGVVELTPHASANTDYFFALAPRGLDVLTGWLDGPAVVMRVHTHDPEAAGCAVDTRTACESAVVVEAVVWPEVPMQLQGERVYRAADRASFPTSHSFLLGGLVTMPDVIPPCPAPVGHTTAENDLIPYCTWEAIDGIHVAPKVDALSDLRNRSVVARVHVNDSEAAACPAAIQADCEAAARSKTSSGPVARSRLAGTDPSPDGPESCRHASVRAIGSYRHRGPDPGHRSVRRGRRAHHHRRREGLPRDQYAGHGVLLSRRRAGARPLISTKSRRAWPDASATQPPADPNAVPRRRRGRGPSQHARLVGGLHRRGASGAIADDRGLLQRPCSPVEILTIHGDRLDPAHPPRPSPPAAP